MNEADTLKESKPIKMYTKAQILNSKAYPNKDLLNALLDEGKTYSRKEVDKLQNDYLKREVK